MDAPNNIHNIVKAQIVFLLSTLTEENFERNQLEIRSVCLFRLCVAFTVAYTGYLGLRVVAV